MVDSLKLSELAEATVTANTDLVDISQDQGGGSYVSKKVQLSNFKANSSKGAIGLTTDAGTDFIVTGLKGYVTIPYNCTITRWDLVADKSGSIVIDVWKRAGDIPTVAHTIAGTEKPTLSSQQISSDTNLTSWTTSVTAGDIIGFYVDSVSAISRVTLTLGVTK